MKKLACVLGLVALLAPAPASASIIEVEFTGLAAGVYGTISPVTHIISLNFFSDRPFTAEFVFNTDFGALTQTASGHRFEGSYMSAVITIDLGAAGTLGSSVPSGWAAGGNYVNWNDDLSAVSAWAGTMHFYLGIGYVAGGVGSGTFQSGICPGSGRCGHATQIDTVSMTIDGVPVAVPGPVVGSGLPALLLGLFALWRRKKSRPAVTGRVVGRLAPSA